MKEIGGRQDLADVVNLGGVVVDGGVKYGKVGREERIGIVWHRLAFPSDARSALDIHSIGAMSHITTMRPASTFMAAQKGTTRGLPVYAICDQSKVMGSIPKPDDIPNCDSTSACVYYSQNSLLLL